MITIQYLLESAFCLACLYALYWLALRRETFFQWNRAYLLLAPVLAFVAPALHIQIEQAAPIPTPATVPAPAPAFDLPVLMEQVQAAPQAVGHTLEQPIWSLSLGEVLWWIYLAGALFFLLHLVLQLYRLLAFLRRCRRTPQAGVVLATGPEQTPLASFFGFVFWQPGETAGEEQRLLFEHEMVHVRQWHSLDLVLMQILIALQWFNPLLYAYRRSLRAVHEYIADENVVRRTRQRHTYARLLANWQATGNGAQPGLVNTFHSLIKTRLIMLAKHPSNPLRRAKYLLALPLFGALLLLFSFRLVEHLPAAKPLRAAIETAGNYAARLSEITIATPALQMAEPTPYIFYWTPLNGKFISENNSDICRLDIESSPEEFREALKREPRLWNGQSLEQHLMFSCNGLQVRSDYNDEAVYNSYRKALELLAADQKAEDVLELKNIALPNGKTGIVRIKLNKAAPNWLPRQSSEVYFQTDPGRELSEFLNMEWGTLDQYNRQFFTETEFWALIQSTPHLYRITSPRPALLQLRDMVLDASGNPVVPEKFSLRLTSPGGETKHNFNDKDNAYTLDELRQKLEALRTEIKPGTVIWITGWLSAILAERTDQQAQAGGSVFQLVAPQDPRLFLKRTDQKTYYLEWGNFSKAFVSSYARSYSTTWYERIIADHRNTHLNAGMTKKDIINMLRLPARLYREKELLTDFNFTLDFKGYGVLVENGVVPEALIAKLERELQPGDVLKITGLQARTDAPREIVMNAGLFNRLRNSPPLQLINSIAIENFGAEKMISLRLSPEAAKMARKEFGDMAGIYVQYGDIDLTNSTIELEVRSDDPKPPLRPTGAVNNQSNILLAISPNPAHEQALVDIQIPEAGPGLLTVTDAAGIVRFSVNIDLPAGRTPFRLPLALISSKGMHVVRLELPYGTGTAKMVVE